MERDWLQRSVALGTRRDQHDLADGLAVSDARLRVVLWPGRRLRRRDVFSRLFSIISSVDVRSQRVQTHLSSTRVRNGDHLGDESRHHRGRHPRHGHGIDNTLNLRIMVSDCSVASLETPFQCPIRPFHSHSGPCARISSTLFCFLRFVQTIGLTNSSANSRPLEALSAELKKASPLCLRAWRARRCINTSGKRVKDGA